jgi:protein NDRG1
MIELAQELVCVLDHFKVTQVTCLGEGAGANICARFAMKHPNRCLGVALIHPTGSTAGIMEQLKDKINNWKSTKQNEMNARAEAYLIWHRFGQVYLKKNKDTF